MEIINIFEAEHYVKQVTNNENYKNTAQDVYK